MKRLLLPLLAALALPTAVNAFPFGNNLEIKNKVGEKTLIKGETVSIEKYSRKDLIEIIDWQIEGLEKRKRKAKVEINSLKKSKRYADDPEDRFIKETLAFYDEELKKIPPLISIKSSLKSKVVKDKSFENIPHVVTVYFTPIYIDINNKKEVGKEEDIYCLNSKLSNSYKRYWKSAWGILLSKKGLLVDKVCKKYAKF